MSGDPDDSTLEFLATPASGGLGPGPGRRRTAAEWAALIVLLLLLFFGCGWLSLVGTRMPASADTASQLQADYRPWPWLWFQPVDPRIVEGVEADGGAPPVIVDLSAGGEAVAGWFWWTPAPVLTPSPTSPPPATAAASATAGTPTGSPSLTSSPSATASQTSSPTLSATPTASWTPSATATNTSTATPTSSATPTSTSTPSSTATWTATNTRTPTITRTPSRTPTRTATRTRTPTNPPPTSTSAPPTNTSVPPTPTNTPVPPTPTNTPVPPTPTNTPVPPTPTDTPVPPTPTDTPVPPTPTDTPAPPTATPTDTPGPGTPTDTPAPPTATPTDTLAPPTATPTDTPLPPTPTPTDTPTDTPLPPTPTPTDTPTDTPVPPTPTPSDTPTNTPVPPTATPTNTPVPPTPTPTDTPTDTPLPPTPTPTDTPTDTPLPPTATPTDTPVPPTATPTNTLPPPTATPTATPAAVTVQTGSCLLSDGATGITCAISPALADTSKTFLVFQATSSTNQPLDGNIRCYLTGTSSMTCDRIGSTGNVTIAWQTASFVSGVTVQHLTPVCNVDGDPNQDITDVTISAVTDMNKTFVLFSQRQAGVSFDANDAKTVQLTSTTNVEVRQSGYATCAAGGSEFALQVVEFSAASVTRGVTGAMTGTSLTVPSLPAVNPAKSFLLYSYRIAGSGTMAAYLLDGQIDSATSLRFDRGASTTQIDAVAWERIELTDLSVVQPVTASMATGESSATVAIASVDPSRTLVLSGGQWTAGQIFGRTDSTGAVIGVGQARHDLPLTTQLRLQRDNNGGNATWHSFVIEFQP